MKDTKEQAETVGSYWEHKGKYQQQYDKAFEKLVPYSGEAEDGLPEALRAISRIGYDYYNNGFGNLWESWEENDDGYAYDTHVINEYYEEMIEYLKGQVPSELYTELRKFIYDAKGYGNWSNKSVALDKVINHIMEDIICCYPELFEEDNNKTS